MELVNVMVTLFFMLIWCEHSNCRRHLRKRSKVNKFCVENKTLNCELIPKCLDVLENFKNPDLDIGHQHSKQAQFKFNEAYKYYSYSFETLAWFMRSNLPTLAENYKNIPGWKETYDFYRSASTLMIENADDEELRPLYRGVHYQKQTLEGKNYLLPGMASFSYNKRIALNFALSNKINESSFLFIKEQGIKMRGKDITQYSLFDDEEEFLSAKDTYIHIKEVKIVKASDFYSSVEEVHKSKSIITVMFEIIPKTEDIEDCA